MLVGEFIGKVPRALLVVGGRFDFRIVFAVTIFRLRNESFVSLRFVGIEFVSCRSVVLRRDDIQHKFKHIRRQVESFVAVRINRKSHVRGLVGVLNFGVDLRAVFQQIFNRRGRALELRIVAACLVERVKVREHRHERSICRRIVEGQRLVIVGVFVFGNFFQRDDKATVTFNLAVNAINHSIEVVKRFRCAEKFHRVEDVFVAVKFVTIFLQADNAVNLVKHVTHLGRKFFADSSNKFVGHAVERFGD